MRDSLRQDARERSLVHLMGLWAGGHLSQVASQAIVHLALHPADPVVAPMLYAAVTANGGDGEQELAWMADNLREQARHAGEGAWWWEGTLAAAYVEQGRHAEAEHAALRALHHEPGCARSAHALMHLHWETGACGEQRPWLNAWLAAHRPPAVAAHFSWHAALYDLAAGDTAAAARHLTAGIPCDDLINHASLHWRLRLLGHITLPPNLTCRRPRRA
ncbi:hypothetical protein [Streptomyces rubiginosohelvolus]